MTSTTADAPSTDAAPSFPVRIVVPQRGWVVVGHVAEAATTSSSTAPR
jgi:hypothetical protein